MEKRQKATRILVQVQRSLAVFGCNWHVQNDLQVSQLIDSNSHVHKHFQYLFVVSTFINVQILCVNQD